jgi:hypothetical protein
MASETDPESAIPATLVPDGGVSATSGRPAAQRPPNSSGVALRERPVVRLREIVAVLLIVVLADFTIYRATGFAGFAAFFVVAPPLLCLGSARSNYGKGLLVLSFMLVLLIVRLLWCGSGLLVACGLALTVAFAMVLAGLRPHVLETFVFASQTVLAGYEGLADYRRRVEQLGFTMKWGIWLSFGLPLAAFVAFSLLFIVANPDLLTLFGETMERVLTTLREWILRMAPNWREMLFWLVVLWVAVGLLRPVVTRSLMEETRPAARPDAAPTTKAMFYAPFRNTLITVIVLFAVYLVFEFKTLWFRVFPEGFHYSGYAHEGAAWLTIALALATVSLSLIFRGQVLQDPRLGRLRWLAWIWSVENLLLAIAVYNRLYIYIGFNGMTRMRMVGLFGMTCVVAGFILVVWKIACNRDFIWLMRRHLWALALTVYLFALTPVDFIAHTYNVRRILAGDPAPSVQISVHPISSEGILVLVPLTRSDDDIIREGVSAMLAQRLEEAESQARRRRQQGWTAYQFSDRLVLNQLRAASESWAEFEDAQRREDALQRFHEYAYQWY